MGFWERYVAACNRKGIRPQTQRNADAFGVTRASITSWKSKNIVPNGSVIAKIAEYLGVTTDYLLGRSDDIESGAPKVDTPVPRVLMLYYSLSDKDRIRAEAYMEGLLTSDRYRQTSEKNA